ncbi:MAG TPA: hypothetical protein VJK90_14360 [Acetobacteraceae bacterium]|nr:hypothetical protein [Acetobacteraceae bacterium]
MTLYLLDANVLREFRPRGHRNVRNWLATVDDAALRVSVMTLLEMRRGWEAKKQHDPAHAAEGLERLFAFETAFKERTSTAMIWRSPRRLACGGSSW